MHVLWKWAAIATLGVSLGSVSASATTFTDGDTMASNPAMYAYHVGPGSAALGAIAAGLYGTPNYKKAQAIMKKVRAARRNKNMTFRQWKKIRSDAERALMSLR